jgi:hypothetical protein
MTLFQELLNARMKLALHVDECPRCEAPLRKVCAAGRALRQKKNHLMRRVEGAGSDGFVAGSRPPGTIAAVTPTAARLTAGSGLEEPQGVSLSGACSAKSQIQEAWVPPTSSRGRTAQRYIFAACTEAATQRSAPR